MAVKTYGGGPIGLSPDDVVPTIASFTNDEVTVSFKQAPGLLQISVRKGAIAEDAVLCTATSVDLLTGFSATAKAHVFNATFLVTDRDDVRPIVVFVAYNDGRVAMTVNRVSGIAAGRYAELLNRRRQLDA